MDEIKKQLEFIKQNPEIERAVSKILELLVEKVDEIPDWLKDYNCCAPGEECCYCS